MADAGCEILFVAGHLVGGGQTRDLQALVHRLGALGHEARIICAQVTGATGLDQLTICPGLTGRWRGPWAARGLRMLGEKSERPRLVHVLESSLATAGLEIAERWNLPYLLAVEDYPAREIRFRLSRSWCRGLVAANSELAEALNREYGIPVPWIHTIPRGISDGPTDPPSRPPGRVPVVGAAGPLVQGSGFATFLSAARRVIDAGVDVEFLIAGEGEDEIELRRRADRLRLTDRITFAGAHGGPFGWWDVLDVFCQTSVTSTIGRSLAQAMAHGVPVVASDVAGLRSWVQPDGNGIQVPPGDPGALSRAILGLLGDDDGAKRLGAAGKATVNQIHDADQEAARLDVLYRRLTRMTDTQVVAPPVVTLNPWRVPGRIGAGAPIAARPVPKPSSSPISVPFRARSIS